MEEKHNDKYKIVNDLSGEPLRLTLKLKEEIKGKDYDLYTICKVVDERRAYTIILWDIHTKTIRCVFQ